MRLVRMRKMRLGGLSVAMACLASVSMTAQSPYGWRGPERDGVYFENGLLKEWPSEGPELLWETMELGKGYSSPVIVDGRLYITGMDEEGTREIFFAYSLDGKKLYQTAYGVPWTDTYPETRTTPTIENGKAYVISGSGEIVCLDTADGKIVWKVDGGKKFERMTGNGARPSVRWSSITRLFIRRVEIRRQWWPWTRRRERPYGKASLWVSTVRILLRS